MMSLISFFVGAYLVLGFAPRVEAAAAAAECPKEGACIYESRRNLQGDEVDEYLDTVDSLNRETAWWNSQSQEIKDDYIEAQCIPEEELRTMIREYNDKNCIPPDLNCIDEEELINSNDGQAMINCDVRGFDFSIYDKPYIEHQAGGLARVRECEKMALEPSGACPQRWGVDLIDGPYTNVQDCQDNFYSYAEIPPAFGGMFPGGTQRNGRGYGLLYPGDGWDWSTNKYDHGRADTSMCNSCPTPKYVDDQPTQSSPTAPSRLSALSVSSTTSLARGIATTGLTRTQDGAACPIPQGYCRYTKQADSTIECREKTLGGSGSCPEDKPDTLSGGPYKLKENCDNATEEETPESEENETTDPGEESGGGTNTGNGGGTEQDTGDGRTSGGGTSGGASNTSGGASNICNSAGAAKATCEACMSGDPPQGVWTAIGCLSTQPAQASQQIFNIALGIGGVIILIQILLGAFGLITSSGNVAAVEKAKKRITDSVIALLFLVFSISLLQLLGMEILRLPGMDPATGGGS